MRWKPGGAGGNVEDRRGRTGARTALPVGGGVVGIIVTVLILFLGGGGYGVDTPFEQFPSQPADNAMFQARGLRLVRERRPRDVLGLRLPEGESRVPPGAGRGIRRRDPDRVRDRLG